MDPKLLKMSVPALRAEYRAAMKRAKKYGGAKDPAHFRERLGDYLKSEPPTPADWVWAAICYAEDCYEGWCDGEADRRMGA